MSGNPNQVSAVTSDLTTPLSPPREGRTGTYSALFARYLVFSDCCSCLNEGAFGVDFPPNASPPLLAPRL